MKLVVVGHPLYEDTERFNKVLDSIPYPLTLIITGNAKGTEGMARKYARGKGIPCLVYNHSLKTHGKEWLYKRNILLVNDADNIVAFVQPNSPILRSIKPLANKMRKRINMVYIEEIEDPSRWDAIASRYGEEI